MQNDLKEWIWLNSLKNVSCIKKLLLLKYFESPKNIQKAKEKDLKEIRGITKANINNILDKVQIEYCNKLTLMVLNSGIEVIKICDKTYPDLLKTIYDPPILIYKKGNFFENKKALAVVGSRNQTTYGGIVTENLVKNLVLNGYTIVSGMAKGIDALAHKVALNCGGKTIAVLGCGLDIVYPPENKNLMDNIICNGAVISEYAVGTKPMPYNFPMRNRIISGISLGVIVVEASEKSGSLITADLALNEGREVFAVPGNITSKNSKGTNQLIKDGAKIVTEVDDILDEFKNNFGIDKIKYINNTNLVNNKIIDSNLTNFEKKILECLSFEEMHIDLIFHNTKIPIDEVSSILMLLEIKGFVRSLPGNFYVLSGIS